MLKIRALCFDEDPLRPHQKRLARLRQGYPSSEPVEQPDPEFDLQCPYLLRERGLRHAQPLRRPREVGEPCRLDEVPYLPELHR